MKTLPNEPAGISADVTLWIELLINRVLQGHRVNLEFTMFPHRNDSATVIMVDTGRSRSKDEAAHICKLAVAKESPDEYLFASESYLLMPNSYLEKRYIEAVQRGDMSLKDVPGRQDILMFVYGNETREYLHVVHLKNTSGKYSVTGREWIESDDESKQVGRFVGFRELQKRDRKRN